MKLISFSEALEILQDCDERGVPKPFSITFCTADRGRGTGGEIIQYDRAIWHVKNGRKPDVAPASDLSDGKGRRERPQHGARWSRNIRGLNSDQIRRVNAHLILSINGLDVR